MLKRLFPPTNKAVLISLIAFQPVSYIMSLLLVNVLTTLAYNYIRLVESLEGELIQVF